MLRLRHEHKVEVQTSSLQVRACACPCVAPCVHEVSGQAGQMCKSTDVYSMRAGGAVKQRTRPVRSLFR
eukprot:5770033-Alexandrium_andersonii.AAC.1